MASASISGHPEEQRIISELLSGKPLRRIRDSVHPPVSISALSRYRVANLGAKKAETLATFGDKHISVVPVKPKSIAGQAGLAVRENRIKLRQALADKLLQVIDERAKDMICCESCRRPRISHPWTETREDIDGKGKKIQTKVGCDHFRSIPGGTTGLIVRRPRAGGLIEYAIDNSPFEHLNALTKDIAIEMGQWQEGHNSTQLQVQIVVPWTGEGERPAVRVSHADDPINTIEVSDMAVVQNPV